MGMNEKRVVLADTARDNRHKVKHIKFHLNTRKHSSPVRVAKHWHQLPRDAEESPSVEIFKS